MKNKKILMFLLSLNVLIGNYVSAASTMKNNYDKPHGNTVKNIDAGKTNVGNYKLIEQVLNKRNKELKDLYAQSDYVEKPGYLEWQVFFSGFYDHKRGGNNTLASGDYHSNPDYDKGGVKGESLQEVQTSKNVDLGVRIPLKQIQYNKFVRKVNGQDVREVKQTSLRDRIGYIPQKALLFSGTIESNLKYAKEDATQEELDKAIEIAQAKNIIQEKAGHYEEPISQGGTNVSGGQKQRLSIARALVKNPDIYIYDDSFSALDYKTDAALRAALEKDLSDKTLIVVAQRISTIMNADQIIVLNDGQVVGKGTHDELMDNCEVYREIAFSQLSKEELNHE